MPDKISRLTLWKRTPTETEAKGPEEFSFSVLENILAGQKASVNRVRKLYGKKVTVYVRGRAWNQEETVSVEIREHRTFLLTGGFREIVAVVRAIMRDKVKELAGFARGSTDSPWTYLTSLVQIAPVVTRKRKPKKKVRRGFVWVRGSKGRKGYWRKKPKKATKKKATKKTAKKTTKKRGR